MYSDHPLHSENTAKAQRAIGGFAAAVLQPITSEVMD